MSKAPRPLRTDGEVTRARIIDAAGELFAERGFGQTQNKEIASRAEVDLASINYHFGGRDALYQVVLAEAHRRFVALPDLGRLVQGDATPQARLGNLIEFLVLRASDASAWHARVLARELLTPSPRLRPLLEAEMRPKLALVIRLLSEITAIPENDPALVYCLLSIGAPCAMLLVTGAALPGPFKDIASAPGATLIAHLQNFALAGLGAAGRKYALGSTAG